MAEAKCSYDGCGHSEFDHGEEEKVGAVMCYACYGDNASTEEWLHDFRTVEEGR